MLLYHSLVECHVIKLGKLYHANLLMVYMLNYVKCTQIIDIIDRHAYEIDGASMDVKYIQRKKRERMYGCAGSHGPKLFVYRRESFHKNVNAVPH